MSGGQHEPSALLSGANSGDRRMASIEGVVGRVYLGESLNASIGMRATTPWPPIQTESKPTAVPKL